MVLVSVSKPATFTVITFDGDASIVNYSKNLIYVNTSTNSTVILPQFVAGLIGGYLYIHNNGPSFLYINTYPGDVIDEPTPILINAGFTALFSVDVSAGTWRTLLNISNSPFEITNTVSSGLTLVNPPFSTAPTVKRLIAGTNVTLTDSTNNITIDVTGTGGTVTSVNNATLTGSQLVVAPFNTTPTVKTLVAGANIILTSLPNSIQIDASGTMGPTMLTQLTDVNIVAPINKQGLIWDNGTLKWINSNVINTLTNTGAGTGTILVNTGAFSVYDSALKSIIAATGLSLINNTSDITLTNTGLLSLASVGAGSTIVVSGSGAATVKSFIASTGISITNNTNDLTILNTGLLSLASVGAGTGTLVVSGSGSATVKSLIAGTNISITNNANDITLTNTGPDALDELADVNINTPINKQGLIYDSGATEWINSNVINTLVNTGAGTGTILVNTGAFSVYDSALKTILASTGISLVNNTSDITLANTGVITIASVGAGSTIVVSGSGSATLKSFIASTGISIANNANDLTVSNTGLLSLASVGAGTGTLVVSGSGAATVKSLIAGTNISITNNANDITLTNTGPTTLAGLSDVNISSPVNKQGLIYDSGATEWINSNVINTLVNTGAGTGTILVNTGAFSVYDSALKTIIASTGLSLTNNTSDITLTNTGLISLASVGSGSTIVVSGSGAATVKSFIASTGISIANNANDLTISNTGVISIADVGAGTGTLVVSGTGSATIKSIASGSGISITNNANDITLSNSGVLTLTTDDTTVITPTAGTIKLSGSVGNARSGIQTILGSTSNTAQLFNQRDISPFVVYSNTSPSNTVLKNAYTSIKTAYDAAVTAGFGTETGGVATAPIDIIVLPGTYTESGTINLVPGVNIIGIDYPGNASNTSNQYGDIFVSGLNIRCNTIGFATVSGIRFTPTSGITALTNVFTAATTGTAGTNFINCTWRDDANTTVNTQVFTLEHTLTINLTNCVINSKNNAASSAVIYLDNAANIILDNCLNMSVAAGDKFMASPATYTGTISVSNTNSATQLVFLAGTSAYFNNFTNTSTAVSLTITNVVFTNSNISGTYTGTSNTTNIFDSTISAVSASVVNAYGSSFTTISTTGASIIYGCNISTSTTATSSITAFGSTLGTVSYTGNGSTCNLNACIMGGATLTGASVVNTINMLGCTTGNLTLTSTAGSNTYNLLGNNVGTITSTGSATINIYTCKAGNTSLTASTVSIFGSTFGTLSSNATTYNLYSSTSSILTLTPSASATIVINGCSCASPSFTLVGGTTILASSLFSGSTTMTSSSGTNAIYYFTTRHDTLTTSVSAGTTTNYINGMNTTTATTIASAITYINGSYLNTPVALSGTTSHTFYISGSSLVGSGSVSLGNSSAYVIQGCLINPTTGLNLNNATFTASSIGCTIVGCSIPTTININNGNGSSTSTTVSNMIIGCTTGTIAIPSAAPSFSATRIHSSSIGQITSTNSNSGHLMFVSGCRSTQSQATDINSNNMTTIFAGCSLECANLITSTPSAGLNIILTLYNTYLSGACTSNYTLFAYSVYNSFTAGIFTVGTTTSGVTFTAIDSVLNDLVASSSNGNTTYFIRSCFVGAMSIGTILTQSVWTINVFNSTIASITTDASMLIDTTNITLYNVQMGGVNIYLGDAVTTLNFTSYNTIMSSFSFLTDSTAISSFGSTFSHYNTICTGNYSCTRSLTSTGLTYIVNNMYVGGTYGFTITRTNSYTYEAYALVCAGTYAYSTTHTVGSVTPGTANLTNCVFRSATGTGSTYDNTFVIGNSSATGFLLTLNLTNCLFTRASFTGSINPVIIGCRFISQSNLGTNANSHTINIADNTVQTAFNTLTIGNSYIIGDPAINVASSHVLNIADSVKRVLTFYNSTFNITTTTGVGGSAFRCSWGTGTNPTTILNNCSFVGNTATTTFDYNYNADTTSGTIDYWNCCNFINNSTTATAAIRYITTGASTTAGQMRIMNLSNCNVILTSDPATTAITLGAITFGNQGSLRIFSSLLSAQTQHLVSEQPATAVSAASGGNISGTSIVFVSSFVQHTAAIAASRLLYWGSSTAATAVTVELVGNILNVSTAGGAVLQATTASNASRGIAGSNVSINGIVANTNFGLSSGATTY